MNSRTLITAILYFLAISHSGAWAEEGTLIKLLDKSPLPPNAMGYVHVGSLNKLMAEQGLTKEVSENVAEYWFIAELEMGTSEPRWEAGYATLNRAVGAETIVKQVGGYLDNVQGKTPLMSPLE